MLTKFGVVCSTASASIRRYVFPDSDAHMDAAANLSPGETLILVSIGPYPNSAACKVAVNAAITAALGKSPRNPRCAVIDSGGTVVAIILADPSIDSVPGMTLIQDLNVSVGWTWTAQGGFAPSPTLISG